GSDNEGPSGATGFAWRRWTRPPATATPSPSTYPEPRWSSTASMVRHEAHAYRAGRDACPWSSQWPGEAGGRLGGGHAPSGTKRPDSVPHGQHQQMAVAG